jgi:predicted transcriptional regulator
MTVAELKLKIFRQVDSMEKSRLEELYGVMLNYINSKKDLDDWTKLTTEQQQGIIDAIEEIESGKGIPHETVMTNIRRKYSHA